MSFNWFCVETSPQHERLATEEINRLGIETFFPTFRKKITHAGKIEFVHKSLFPNYIFVNFDLAQAEIWAPIKRTRGVRRILGNSHPQVVRGDFMSEIQAYQTMTDKEPEKPVFWKGQKVTVTSGPFMGLHGIYEMSDRDRITILLDMLGGKVKVTVSETAVAA